MPYVEIYEKMGFIGPGVYNFSERFARKLVRLGKGKYVEKKPNVVKEEKQALETKEEKQAPKVTKKRTKKK